MLQDRSYQTEAVGAIYNYFATKKGNPLVAMPTGTGKSIVIARFLESIFRSYPNQRVLVLTHVKELIEQNYDKLKTVWPNAPAGINSAGLGRNDFLHPIIFAGIASVAKKAMYFGHVDLVLIDEAHLLSPNENTMYQKFLSELLKTNPAMKVIGFTATKWRLGHGDITEGEGAIFTDTCFDITTMHAFNRLIAEGYLAPLIPKHTRALLDVDGVHMRGGEYIQSELQNAVDRDEITAAALREALEMGHDRRHWLIFCAGVEHAINVAQMLTSMGFPCATVHSKMTDAERDKNIADFKAGRVRAITNNNVLTTGFDMPGIDLILMLRPTASPVLWVQMLGRGTRPFSCAEWTKENCLVLDFAGNTRRLGPINDPVVPRRKGQKGGEAPVKLCGSCATYNHASVRFCVCCGQEFIVQTKLKAAASTEQLIKGDTPIVEVFKVDHITYAVHRKHDVPDMIRVSYYCGLRMFNEFVCIEHEGFAGRKARHWWRDRTETPMPATTAEALEIADTLKPATHLRMWVNKKYPEILKTCFDNTAFGTVESDGVLPSIEPTGVPTENIIKPNLPTKQAYEVTDQYDDDIPF